MSQVEEKGEHELVKLLKELTKKLKRTPTRAEFTGSLKGGQYKLEHSFGTYGRLKAAAGIEDDIGPIQPPERIQIVKLKKELDEARALLKSAESEAVNSHKIIEMVESIDCSKLGAGSEWLKGPKQVRATTGIPVLFFSDYHYDEVVKPEQIGFVNEFNRDIAEARAKHTFNTTVQLLKRHMVNPRYEGIVLALGGDLLSGNIHEELRETNEACINVSIMRVVDVLISGIDLFLHEFKKVFVVAVVGNHSRIDPKPRAKNRVYDNYEWLIYQLLARHYKSNPNVSFLIPEGPDAQFSIFSKSFLLTHGDQFRGGTGIAGLMSPLMLGLHRKQKRQQAVNKPFDILMIGHWHQYVHMQSLIVNGSVKGLDEYAYQGNFGFEPPQQACFIVHPEHGVTFRMPVLCDSYRSKERTASTKRVQVVW